MNKPIYVAPSIFLSMEDRIIANQEFSIALKAWEASQITETE